MSFRAHRFICLIVFVLLLPCAGFAATPVTYLYLNSQPGDFIGQGIAQKFTPADGTFSLSKSSTAVIMSFNTPDYGQYWTVSFNSSAAVKVGKGQYEAAHATSFLPSARPGIDIYGDGRACGNLVGRFLVSDFSLAADGTLARLAIDFEQHCLSFAEPALYGSFRYNSSVSQVSRLGISAVGALKGNAGTSDALATVALSIPSANPVTVQYATTDGTALQGTDYLASAGSVTFPAGTTSQTVVVPILGDRLARGNKTFKLSLKAPTGALLGTAFGSVLIRDPNVGMNALAVSSQTGEWVGQGKQYLISPSDAIFTASASANVVQISVNNWQLWSTNFAGPSTTRLKPGEYVNAESYPFQPAGTPGIAVYGEGRGCTSFGNFDVLKAGYSSTGSLQSFSADFEQHCREFPSPALFGSIRFHSLLQQFSVSNAVVQGSSATFTMTLNPALAKSVTVTFSTADGTAISGTDYAATTQTLTFSPGMIEQTVTVPLLSSGNVPQKTLFGH